MENPFDEKFWVSLWSTDSQKAKSYSTFLRDQLNKSEAGFVARKKEQERMEEETKQIFNK